MTVEAMIDEVKSAIQRHSVGVAMGQWDSAYSATDQFAEAVFIGLFSLGVPLETLAALRNGTMKAVPVDPTLKMVARGEATHAGGGGAVAIYDAMLFVAPIKPGYKE